MHRCWEFNTFSAFLVFASLIFSCISNAVSAETSFSRETSLIRDLHRSIKGLGIFRYPVCKIRELYEDENETPGENEVTYTAPSSFPSESPAYSPSTSFYPPPSPSTTSNSSSASIASVDRVFTWGYLNVAAIILASFCAMLANSAGIGGGPLFMPLFNSVLGFDVDVATALSHTVVSASAIASTCYGTTQPNPFDKRVSLIDFTLALTFIPPLLIGANLGVVLNTLFPEWSQSLGLFVLLTYVAYVINRKAKKTWQVETRIKELEASEIKELRAVELSDEEEGKVEEKEREGVEEVEERNEDAGMVESSSAFTRLQISIVPILRLIVLWSIFLVFTILMSRVEKCSFRYFALWGAQTIFCAIVSYLMILHVKEMKSEKSSGMRALLLPKGDEEENADDHVPKLLKLVAIMLASGTIAGLLGIGGGVVYNPFFLSMGVHPQVTASTSVLMILFSSSAIFISFALEGLLNTSYASVFVPFCFCASLLGVAIVGRIVRKTKRASIIIFILTFYMVLGALMTLLLGGYSAIEDFIDDTDIGFQSFCS